MIPLEKTTAYIASTPTVEETMGPRPTAAQPRNKALEAIFVRNSTKRYVKNLQTQINTALTEVKQPIRSSGNSFIFMQLIACVFNAVKVMTAAGFEFSLPISVHQPTWSLLSHIS